MLCPCLPWNTVEAEAVRRLLLLHTQAQRCIEALLTASLLLQSPRLNLRQAYLVLRDLAIADAATRKTNGSRQISRGLHMRAPRWILSETCHATSPNLIMMMGLASPTAFLLSRLHLLRAVQLHWKLPPVHCRSDRPTSTG